MGNVLVMIPRWAFSIKDKLLRELDKIGDRTQEVVVDNIPLEVIAEHYSRCNGAPFFEDLVNDFSGKSAVVVIYKGDPGQFLSAKKGLRA